jgi:hypothetical protein
MDWRELGRDFGREAAQDRGGLAIARDKSTELRKNKWNVGAWNVRFDVGKKLIGAEKR